MGAGIRNLAALLSSLTLLLACGDGMLLTVGHVAQRIDGGSTVPPPPQRDADTPAPESGIIGGCPQCQSCPAGTKTTISGTVFDPAGKVPLYNVIVYVPKTVERPADTLTCDVCAGTVHPAGNAVSLSQADGTFLIDTDVPSGTNVSIVIQIGKWQRAVQIPKVNPCQDNPLDPSLTHLPRNHLEGHLPQIAVTTGHSDALECLLRRIGIDDSEFTADTGSGRVHMFAGCDGGSGLPANQFSAALGGAKFADATTLWSSKPKLMNYDMLVLSCEGSQCAGDKEKYVDNIKSYADQGGRLFLDHLHFYWLLNGPAPWPDTADYIGPNGKDLPTPFTAKVDTTFPKGAAFADWLVRTHASAQNGLIDIWNVQFSVRKTVPGTTQQWIYTDQNPRDSSGLAVEYMTMNTPTPAEISDASAQPQCGRVVYTDLHVVGANMADAGAGAGTKDVSHADTPFPNGCVAGDLTPQEKALEFMFFDLSSCIQKDTDKPSVTTILR